MNGVKLWAVTVAASAVPFLTRMLEADPTNHSPLDLANHRAFLDNWRRVDREMGDHEPWEREAVRFRTAPVHLLQVEEPSFDLDYFFIRHDYASARLRDVLALGPDEIDYRPIDASRCTDAARAMDYQAFLALKVANPFDPARMPGRVRPLRQEDGSTREEWMVEMPTPDPNAPPTPVYFRPNFEPPAPLFRAMGLRGLTIATEDLADRVARARMTGMGFREIEGDGAATETVYRDH